MCFHPAQITQLTEYFMEKVMGSQEFAPSEYTRSPDLWFNPEQRKIKLETHSNNQRELS